MAKKKTTGIDPRLIGKRNWREAYPEAAEWLREQIHAWKAEHPDSGIPQSALYEIACKDFPGVGTLMTRGALRHFVESELAEMRGTI